MAKPLYVDAFEHFKSNNEDPLKAYVAFGLYVDAECKWASAQMSWPTAVGYKHYYECSLPHTANNYQDTADVVLLQFANTIVEQERQEFIGGALEEFKVEAAKSRSFWKGVLEAATGAAAWSMILIIAAIVATRLGIDVLEAYHKAADKYQQHAPAPSVPPPP